MDKGRSSGIGNKFIDIYTVVGYQLLINSGGLRTLSSMSWVVWTLSTHTRRIT